MVEVPLSRQGSLTAELDLGPRDNPMGPIQMVTALWNDQEIARYKIPDGGGKFRISIPPESQHIGLNTLTLLPHFWTGTRWRGKGDADIRSGFRLRNLHFEGDAKTSIPAEALRVTEEGIQQSAGSHASFFTVLPDSAQLRGYLEPVFLESDSRILVTVRRDGEAPRVHAEWTARSFPSDEPVPFIIPLEPLAGEAVEVTLVMEETERAASSERQAAILWRDLYLAGMEDRFPEPAVVTPARRPNVLVVLFDTLRADFTSPYGAPEARTPNMQRLAEEGVTFLNAVSNASSTRPSVASLLTGLPPAVHKVDIVETGLSAEAPFLPQVLAEAGYVTIGVSDNPHISGDWGFDRGFDYFAELHKDEAHARYRQTATPEELAGRTWGQYVTPFLPARGAKPFFVYLHEIDPHYPYDPPATYDRIEDFGYRGALLAHPDQVAEQRGIRRFAQTLALLENMNQGITPVDVADIRYIQSRYSAEVRYMDAYLGWILARLEQLQLRDDTLVILLSDHGEEFLEHGRWTHGHALYEESLRVPLVFSMPGTLPAGTSSTERVELLDLPRTIYDLAGIQAPGSIQGRSLHGAMWSAPGTVSPSTTFALGDKRYHRIPGPEPHHVERQESVQHRGWKLVRDLYIEGELRVDDRLLYDLGSDPDETVNLWAKKPIHGLALLALLEDAARRNDASRLEAEAGTVDEAARSRLHALGYLQ